MNKYDYLIVGSGLFGSIFAYEANKRGKKCLVIDKRSHIGGNIYCENVEEELSQIAVADAGPEMKNVLSRFYERFKINTKKFLFIIWNEYDNF